MLYKGHIEDLIHRSLSEDIGGGDLTTELLIPETSICTAELYSKAKGILAGIEIPGKIFSILDEDALYEPLCADGSALCPGQVLARIKGRARALLTGERTSLNFLQHLSGIATITHEIVSLLARKNITILDTRKTIPGLRLLQKYAVTCGGGKNHRIGLYDGILIKNNHLRFSPLGEAVMHAKQEAPPHIKVEVEVETLKQVEEAVAAGADIIMLDNMDIPLMSSAISKISGRAKVEISGNITEETIPALRSLAIDYISMGRLTHSAKALDISLRITGVEK
jgi:nicotinate-nucleotide pyrophosphorylase (carboxylating)